MLASLPDGTSHIVVTITVCSQNSQIKNGKPVRLVKLSSKPLISDKWIDLTIIYHPLSNIETDYEKGEKARVSLYIDGILHASTEDYFGRFRFMIFFKLIIKLLFFFFIFTLIIFFLIMIIIIM